jgi:protein-tyrosine phosphatase
VTIVLTPAATCEGPWRIPQVTTSRSAQIGSRVALVTTLAVGATSLAHAVIADQQAERERRIALEGAPNLRDLGGYRTGDGLTVTWGRVYRSGQLAALTDRDYERLAGLGIVAVCDFRRDDERSAAQTVWKAPNPPKLLVMTPSAPRADAETPVRRPDPVGVMRAGGSAEQVAADLRASYETFAERYAGSYRQIIDLLIEQDGAVLYHCTAGKDRTGTFSAVLLTLLGVPRDTIEADYLLSNEYVATRGAVAQLAARSMVSEDAVRALLGVDRSYLDAAFAAIDGRFGSFDAYRRTALGLTDADLARLKERLLTR